MANDATVCVTGNLIRDPVHNTVNGQTVVSFTVAANTTMKKEDGNGYESNFYNVSYWGKPAEWLLDKIEKGTMVEVCGDLILEKYKNKQGVEGQSLNVKAFKVTPRARLKGAPKRETASASMDPVIEERPF